MQKCASLAIEDSTVESPFSGEAEDFFSTELTFKECKSLERAIENDSNEILITLRGREEIDH